MTAQFTQLSSRKMWFDGDTECDSSLIESLLLKGISPTRLWVTELTSEIKNINRLSSSDQRIKSGKSTAVLPPVRWAVPEMSRQQVLDYILNKFDSISDELSEDQCLQRLSRIKQEWQLYVSNGLVDHLRALIYVINTLISHNVVWGVGRGSSVSSYILFLIGTHDVDSVKYDLDIRDFFHD